VILDGDATIASEAVHTSDVDEASYMPSSVHSREDLERAVSRAVGLGNDPGLGLLLDLAKRGEYDPWNVDIVSVTDSYLTALDDQLDARELSHVARLIFYAAALIHLKSKVLAERQKELDFQDAFSSLDDELLDPFNPFGPVSRLHPGDSPLEYGFMLDGRGGLGGLTPRERPVRQPGLTLLDLIHALKDYDERLAHQELMDMEAPEFTEDMVLKECVGSSHQEDLDQDIIDVRELLWKLLEDAERVEIEQLITPQRSRGATYLALLFLANDEEVHLEQEVLYEALHVLRGPFFGQVVAGLEGDVELRLAELGNTDADFDEVEIEDAETDDTESDVAESDDAEETPQGTEQTGDSTPAEVSA